MKHREKHPEYVPGCFGCKAASVVGFSLQGGREQWHDEASLGAREKQAIADARRGGIEPERA